MFFNTHPNPQFERKKWMNLNGEWKFAAKAEPSVLHKINVPFCPESELSGLNIKGFLNECVYEREFFIPTVGLDELLIIHFGAVDYEARVYVNNKYVGKHVGGYTPFSFDITNFVREGENSVKVKVYDNVQDNVPSGKQSEKEESFGCFYTRCTGIWQTVWLEVVPKNHITSVKFFPHIDNSSVDMEISTCDAGEMEITVLYDGKQVGYYKSDISCKATFSVNLSEKHLWEIGEGRLYDVILRYGSDEVKSYFGLREVKFDGYKFLLNGKSVFQRFVLNQGYYPDGVYTPKDDDAIVRDIRAALDLGFNGMRLHQKVFNPKFLYYCDKAGCMVWGEFPSWGIKYYDLSALGTLTREWIETLERDFNHPSVILWCPLNETWKDLKDGRKSRDVRFIDAIYALTKSIDDTRPCVDVSGGYHGHKTDLYDFHCYENLEDLKKYIDRIDDESVLDVPLLYDVKESGLRYRNQLPINVSECGGVKFVLGDSIETKEVPVINECAVTSTEDWGYGKGCNDEDDFVSRYARLVKAISSSSKISGFCYTQLYDVEQEQNGFLTYDRKAKLSDKGILAIKAINQAIAEIEK